MHKSRLPCFLSYVLRSYAVSAKLLGSVLHYRPSVQNNVDVICLKYVAAAIRQPLPIPSGTTLHRSVVAEDECGVVRVST